MLYYEYHFNEEEYSHQMTLLAFAFDCSHKLPLKHELCPILKII